MSSLKPTFCDETNKRVSKWFILAYVTQSLVYISNMFLTQPTWVSLIFTKAGFMSLKPLPINFDEEQISMISVQSDGEN